MRKRPSGRECLFEQIKSPSRRPSRQQTLHPAAW
jgi:hypothetical protein